ncbi:MAG: hypothetical protein KOO60_14390 [Gemmatimonadales bacterium]|nr:hypothetical protein [Gemmatimonadales bacterium]
MKSKLIKFVLICLAVVVWTGSAQALTCNLTVPSIYMSGGKFLVCPAGDGDLPTYPPFTLQLLDVNLAPIENYPFEDIRLEFVDPNPGPFPRVSFGFCAGFVADANTDANGMTTFSGGPIFACGSVRNPLIQVVINSSGCGVTPTNVEIVNVDFNCDGRVTQPGDNPVMTALSGTWASDLNHNTTGGDVFDAIILSDHIYNLLPQPHVCP